LLRHNYTECACDFDVCILPMFIYVILPQSNEPRGTAKFDYQPDDADELSFWVWLDIQIETRIYVNNIRQ